MCGSSVAFIVVWLLIGPFGMSAAAIAWVGRSVLDALLLFSVANRFLIVGKSADRWKNGFKAFTVLVLLGTGMLPMNIMIKSVYLFIVFVALIFLTWFKFLSQEEKAIVQKTLNLRAATNCNDE